MDTYEYSIKLSQHLYEYVPLWKLSIDAQKTLNKVKKYAPIETGRLQDSIQILTDGFDAGYVTIYVNTRYFTDYDADTPYYAYLNDRNDSHYRRGAFKGQNTKGWWDRLCKAFDELWKARADKLETYERKESETGASAKEHRKKVETDSINKMKTENITKSQMEQDVKNVGEQDKKDFISQHKALRGLTYERKGYLPPSKQAITRMSVEDMQNLSVENMQYLIEKELGIKITKGYAVNKKTFWKMRKELQQISKDYGELKLGGLPLRTIIRELIRKLQNSEHMNAY